MRRKGPEGLVVEEDGDQQERQQQCLAEAAAKSWLREEQGRARCGEAGNGKGKPMTETPGRTRDAQQRELLQKRPRQSYETGIAVHLHSQRLTQ